MAVCTFEGCDNPMRARGWCVKHYRRWSTHGDPSIVKVRSTPPPRDPWVRLQKHIVVCDGSGCWEWHASRTSTGYGQIAVAKRPEKAHRVAWEHYHGPIPKGMHIHHTCKNRLCVNPEHLELLTPFDHVHRHMVKS